MPNRTKSNHVELLCGLLRLRALAFDHSVLKDRKDAEPQSFGVVSGVVAVLIAQVPQDKHHARFALRTLGFPPSAFDTLVLTQRSAKRREPQVLARQ